MSEFNPSFKVERDAGIKPARKTSQGRTKKETPTVPESSDMVKLSPAARIPGSRKTSEVRQEIVDRFKSVLGNGAYQVKADEIADKMVQKIRENKGPSIF